MPYLITNGNEYIMKNRNGKYVAIRNPAMADEFKKQVAENILKNTLPKKLRSKMYLEKVDTGKKKTTCFWIKNGWRKTAGYIALYWVLFFKRLSRI